MNMEIKAKLCCLLMVSLVSTSSVAVEVNHKGLGEVLIYPFYTVNNDLNTLYSVVNTTADTKAVSVRFLEGDNGLEVLTFNIYLSGFDVWTGGLIPAESTVAGHEGEPSVIHLTTDTSCAPFLVKSGQEFLPFVIDTDLDVDNLSLKRARDGYIEIIEMATFNGLTVPNADHGTFGVPPGCSAIENDWSDDGIYNFFVDAAEPTGDLMGSASLVNVLEGLSFSYDAIALQNFWQGEGLHSEPGSLEPNLSSAFPESKVLLDSGELITSEWEHGFQAVSAVLTQSQIMNEYAFDSIVAGKTEWVMTFPTKKYHVNSTEDNLLSPFSQLWNGAAACDAFKIDFWDRETTAGTTTVFNGDPPIPGGANLSMCYSSNVIEFVSAGLSLTFPSQVLGSENNLTLVGVNNALTENGWGAMSFLDSTPNTARSGNGFKGLPVTGFAVQQYTNAGAAEGLLAQYGALFKHKGMVGIDTE